MMRIHHNLPSPVQPPSPFKSNSVGKSEIIQTFVSIFICFGENQLCKKQRFSCILKSRKYMQISISNKKNILIAFSLTEILIFKTLKHTFWASFAPRQRHIWHRHP